MTKRLIWAVALLAIVFGSLYMVASNAPTLFGTAGNPAQQLLSRGPEQYATGCPEKFDGKCLYRKAWEAYRDLHKELADPQKMAAFAEWEKKFDTTGDLDTEAGTDRAIKLMRNSLGQRFDYVLNPVEAKGRNAQIKSDLVGIGIQVQVKGVQDVMKEIRRTRKKLGLTQEQIEQRLKEASLIGPGREFIVIKPMEGGPAFGVLKEGDSIVAVDGVSVTGKNIEEASAMVRGKAGTKVDITVERTDENGVVTRPTFTFTRTPIERHAATYSERDGKAIITVTDFMAANLPHDFDQALMKAQERNVGVIIDLRGNPGGSLASVLTMISRILPRGEIMLQIERVGGTNVLLYNETHLHNGFVLNVMRTAAQPNNPQLQKNRRPPLLLKPNKPIVVLIDGGSASASELLSGTCQANHRCTVVGKPSAGKGVGQLTVPLPYGRQLAITTFEFLPGGIKSDFIGILPDIEVERTADDIKAKRDPQMDAALAEVDRLIAEGTRKTQRTQTTLEQHRKFFEERLAKQRKFDELPVGAPIPDEFMGEDEEE